MPAAGADSSLGSRGAVRQLRIRRTSQSSGGAGEHVGRGNPYHNPRAKSFFKTLKHAEVYLKDYRSSEEAEMHLERSIEDVYNTKRLHSSLATYRWSNSKRRQIMWSSLTRWFACRGVHSTSSPPLGREVTVDSQNTCLGQEEPVFH